MDAQEIKTLNEAARLAIENRKLKREIAAIRAAEIPRCRGCRLLTLHPCGAFAWCPRLGAVDPDGDGCSRKEQGT